MTRRKFINFNAALLLLLLGPAVFVLALGPWIEQRFARPIKTFEVTHTTCEGGCVTVAGWLDKSGCTFVDAYAMVSAGSSYPRVATIEYRGSKLSTRFNRPTGLQAWGPWYIEASPGNTVTLYARHNCHPFWVTETKLAEVIIQ